MMILYLMTLTPFVFIRIFICQRAKCIRLYTLCDEGTNAITSFNFFTKC